MNIRAPFCMHSRMRSVLRYAVINTIFIMRKLLYDLCKRFLQQSN